MLLGHRKKLTLQCVVESPATAGDSLDKFGVSRGITERLTNLSQTSTQHDLANFGLSPNRPLDLGPSDQSPSLGDEIAEHGECFRAQLNFFASIPEAFVCDIQAEEKSRRGGSHSEDVYQSCTPVATKVRGRSPQNRTQIERLVASFSELPSASVGRKRERKR
jgi:hypothetical protein